ncbi:hypothetical protein [Pandoraea pnomenusa]|uniref:hypothetical protein n=1 Tax=Pandoraea pnomenusa TaxID=93220 RepID=UPI0011478790|nr:hypothetical protein [Pandoraea pnomenusa]QDH59571.1 hypothetical protein FKQ53_09960 [Pandoraea pnomenusa]
MRILPAQVRAARGTNDRPSILPPPTHPAPHPDKDFGMFVHQGRYVSISVPGHNICPVPSRWLATLGLPDAPRYEPLIVGVPRNASRTPSPGPDVDASDTADSTDSTHNADNAATVEMELRGLVANVPFAKIVQGVRIGTPSTAAPGGTSPHIVVEADNDVFYVASTLPSTAGAIALRRLDPAIAQDNRCIDLYWQHWRRSGTFPYPIGTADSYRNATHHRQILDRCLRADPASSAATMGDVDPFDIVSSRHAQRDYIDTCRSSLFKRCAFDPVEHEFDLRIYQTLLGNTHVFRIGDRWNLELPSGIRDLRKHLLMSNLAFARLGHHRCMQTVYFSLSGGRRVQDMKLAIHDLMGDDDEITLGNVRFVCAKRRLERLGVTRDRLTAGATHVDLPELASSPLHRHVRTTDAEQLVAAVVEHDMRRVPMVTDIHVNSLLDTCDSCASSLSILQTLTGCPITFVYHQPYGVHRANATEGIVRAMQTLAVTARQLQWHWALGEIPAMTPLARKLIEPALVQMLTHMLFASHTDSEAREALKIQCNAHYLQVLSALLTTGALRAQSVVEMLASPTGLRYLSQLGRRVGQGFALGRRWAGLTQALLDAGQPRDALIRLLLTKPDGLCRNFYVELLDTVHLRGIDCRNALLARLSAQGLRPAYAQIVEMMGHVRGVGLRLRLGMAASRASAALALDKRLPAQAFRQAVELLRDTALNRLQAERLAAGLREIMPVVTVDEQRRFRASLADEVKRAWRDILPGEDPPSTLLRELLDDAAPAFRSALVDHRGAVIRTLIDDTTQAYVRFLDENPDAAPEAVQREFDRQYDLAKARYREIVEDDPPPAASRHAAQHVASQASTSAEAAKAGRAATTAASVAAAKTQATRVAAEPARKAAAQRADEARQIALAAFEASEAKARERAKSAKEMATQATQATLTARAHCARETAASQATTAALTARSDARRGSDIATLEHRLNDLQQERRQIRLHDAAASTNRERKCEPAV